MKQLSFILLLFCSNAIYSQELPPNTQQQLENLADANEEENQEDDQLLQQLDYFRRHPVNLNMATREELKALRFLTDLQIDNLLRYRNLFDKLINIYELQAVPTWDLPTIRKVLPYVMVGGMVTIKENFLSRFKGDQTVLVRIRRVLERSRGFDTSLNTHYLGDRNHLMLRYRYQYKDLLYYGLVAEKDAGEQFFKGSSKGFDFYSVHFFARRLGMVKSLAIGDYAVNLGQGLIQWQSLGFGKSPEVMFIKRQAPVLMPYRSAGEFYFNRGVGITLQKKNMEATFFGSYKKISGNVINDTASERFTSWLTSGYYRTATEIADKNNIKLLSFGGNISYTVSFLKIGLNAVAHQFDIPLEKRDEPYNLYAISGKKVFNSSMDYSYTYKNVHLFGEAAIDKNFNKAFVNGAMISVDPKVDLSLFYRNIQKKYQSLFGNAFTENTMPANEKGIYAGIAIRPVQAWHLTAYADFFQFPWLRYRVNAPSKGYDYLVQLNYQPNKQFELYVRYRNRNKPLDSSGNGVIFYPQDEVKQNLRVHFSNQVSPALSIKSRMELMWYDHRFKNAEQGFLGYVEAAYDWQKLSSNIRLQYFETNSYNSRIYVYEADVMYSFSIPAFYDKGFRYYINLHYDLTKKLECWVRFASTVYRNKKIIGSGMDEIKGNLRSDIKLQLQYSF